MLCVCERKRERVNISSIMIPVSLGHHLNLALLWLFLQTMEEYMSKPAF